MSLIIVEAVLASIKSPVAGDGIRTSTVGKCGFGASTPLLTRASPMHFSGDNKRGLAAMPKLAKLVGPVIDPSRKSYPRASLDLLQRASYACKSSCLFSRLPPWRDLAAGLHAAGLLNPILSL